MERALDGPQGIEFGTLRELVCGAGTVQVWQGPGTFPGTLSIDLQMGSEDDSSMLRSRVVRDLGQNRISV